MDSIERIDRQGRSAAPSARLCLLVLGMHRSGTSALTRMLSIAGAELPADLMGATEANESGHWESARLFRYHDAMLAEFGSAWDDWRALDLSAVPMARRDQIKAELAEIVQAEFAGAPLIVVKDPRICRFAPLFIDAVEAGGYACRVIIPFRSPLEVIDSLTRRDDMSRAKASLLWLRHILDADAATREAKRAFISYDTLLASREAALTRLGAELDIAWPHDAADVRAQIENFLSPAQRHHKSTVEHVMLDPMLRGWVSDAYTALLALEQHPASAVALATLDRVRRDLNAAAPVLSRFMAEVEARSTHQRQVFEAQLVEANHRANGAEALASAREADLAALNAQHGEAATALAARDEEIARLRAETEALRAAVAKAESEAKHALSDIELIRAAMHDREREVATLQSLHEQEIVELEALRQRERELEALRAATPPSFRDSALRPYVAWLAEGEEGEGLDQEALADWLLPSFQNYSEGDTWRINANGVELSELMSLMQGDTEAEMQDRERPPIKSLLLVSDYAPSYAHAGGLRVRDLYVEIKRLRPNVELSLYCPSTPNVDGDISDLGEVFDHIHLTRPEDFSYVDFVLKAGSRRYDLGDFQFHRAGRMIGQFKPSVKHSLFTPMECLSRFAYDQARSNLKSAKSLGLRDVATIIRSTLDELRIVASATDTVCVSDADAAFLQKVAPWRRIDYISTGLSEYEFAEQLSSGYTPKPASAKAKRLVFAAYYGSETNRIGLTWFIDHVHPHIVRHCPDYKLSVVGRGDLSSFIAQNPPNVTFIGEVPTMAPVLEQARAGLVLALNGSGFRGKINQYAVCGLPSISTKLGVTGLNYTADENILIEDDPHKFAIACVRVLNDDAFADQIAASARANALAHYRWDRNHDRIRRIYGL